MTRTLGACCLIKWPKITVAVAASRQEQKQQTQHMTHGPANSGRSVQHHRPITARPTCSQTHEATTPPCCHRGRHDATHAAQAQLLSLCFTEQTTLPYTPAKGTAHTTHERHSSNSHGGTQPVDLQTNPAPPGTPDSCTTTSCLQRHGPEAVHMTAPNRNQGEQQRRVT